jgi:hypothetical protein
MGNDEREIITSEFDVEFNQNDYLRQIIHLRNVNDRQLKICDKLLQNSMMWMIILSIYFCISWYSLTFTTLSFWARVIGATIVYVPWTYVACSIKNLKHNLDISVHNLNNFDKFIFATHIQSYWDDVDSKLNKQTYFTTHIVPSHEEFFNKFENKSYIASLLDHGIIHDII